jgi:hypothetical protein
MKIVNSISKLYSEQKAINEKLKENVDRVIQSIKRDNWHYISRLKSLESFALKLETGRVPDAYGLEDFMACTLVVDNVTQINLAIELLDNYIILVERRPKDPSLTHKESSSFVFDDLRLYAKLKPLNSLEGPIYNIIFEIQIKTFLQHAWGIATHDLIYKTKEINWSKERIAYQIKAQLEHVELTIGGVENLIGMPEIAKSNKEINSLNEIVDFFSNVFNAEDLPEDLVRLCKNTKDLLKHINVSLEDLRTMIETETAVGRGATTKNISPYNIILQSVLNTNPLIIENFAQRRNKFKILVPKEIEFPNINLRHKENFIGLS